MLVYSAVNLRTSGCLNLWVGKSYSFATLNKANKPYNKTVFLAEPKVQREKTTQSNNRIGNNSWSSERARGQCTLATLAVINYDQTITIKPPITAAARNTARAYAQLRCCSLLSVGSTNAGLTSGLSRRAFHRCFTLHNSCLSLFRPINKVY